LGYSSEGIHFANSFAFVCRFAVKTVITHFVVALIASAASAFVGAGLEDNHGGEHEQKVTHLALPRSRKGLYC